MERSLLERRQLERSLMERSQLEQQDLERSLLERRQLERSVLERSVLERRQLERRHLGRTQLGVAPATNPAYNLCQHSMDPAQPGPSMLASGWVDLLVELPVLDLNWRRPGSKPPGWRRSSVG